MEIKLLPCPLCFKPHFQGVDSLRSSLINVATSHLTCPVCSESLLGLDKLTIHLFTHISENNNNNNSSVKHFEETATTNNEKEIAESINNFKETPKEDDNDPVKCDICYFTFTDKALLDMHQNLLHQTTPDKNTGLYSYHCHLCSKIFKKRGSLMVHLRVAHYGFGHHNFEQLSKNMDTVKLDIQSPKLTNEQFKFQDNKQWECDVCSKMFTTKYFLKKHKRLHTGEMPYFCAQCNKSFTFQQSYHKHMLYHSSEKPYICTECGRAFKELSTLQNHARIHSGERPFGCETCGKRFRQRVSYLVHQRIHTGVMPYKCTACGKSFRYKVSQRSHKCLMNPPGSVVRVADLEKAQNSSLDVMPNINYANTATSVKCIMSVDYNTGSINFIQNEKPLSVYLGNSAIEDLQQRENFVDPPNDTVVTNHTIKIQDSSSPIFSTEHQDLFSMVLSPLMPDVESLCLTNTVENMDSRDTKICDNLQIVNDDSFKDLVYRSQNQQ